MNLPVPAYHSQLPAFLRDPALFAETDKAIAGIGGGMPPYISIRGAKFHLISADGEEAQVNQLSLDVIVLGGNEHVSKAYYAGAYDPAQGGGAPPTCFSDNGVAPSVNAMTPQAPLCAGCAFNAWGSKVTPTGSQVKACTDSKKIVVVLAPVDAVGNGPPLIVNGVATQVRALEQVFLLKIPAASMTDWKTYGKYVSGKGFPVTIGVVTRLSFDPAASYPKLNFAVASLTTEAVGKPLIERRLLPDIAEIVGANDVPRTTGLGSGGQQGQVAPIVAATVAAALTPPPAPAPLPLAPLPAPAPLAPAPQPQAEQRRTRGRPAATQPLAQPAAPALFGNGSAVIVQPTPAGNELDALLAEALK